MSIFLVRENGNEKFNKVFSGTRVDINIQSSKSCTPLFVVCNNGNYYLR